MRPALRWRLILGPSLALGLAVLFTLDAYTGRDAWGLLFLALIISLRATWELTRLLQIRSISVQSGLVQIANVCVICANWHDRLAADPGVAGGVLGGLGPVALAYALAVMAVMWSEAYRFQSPGRTMESLGAEIFIISYVGVLLSLTVQLRWVAGIDGGYLALGSLVIAAKSGDIGAYFLGKFFGRRKLIERLSPGKTWMGAVGALLGAAAGSLLWFSVVAPLLKYRGSSSLIWPVVYGIVLGITGLMGDLCESLIKRDTGRKDSAELLPEMGGILDIVDSVIYAAPLAYLLWLILPL